MFSETNEKKHLYQNLPHLSLGWELALPIFGGVFLGYQLDRYLQSQYIFTLTFLFLGTISAYYNLYKYIELEILRTKIFKSRIQKEN